ncbi:MAG: VWA domain-containing protein [Fuerstiella sp.]|nr:VWA domain-containing protein [Fuerstiella sp.]MCP4856599.1 VWA domain-containing protein [Fuerstiella sp.]
MVTRLTLLLALFAFTTSAMGQVPIINRVPGRPVSTEFRIGSVDVTADIVDQVAKVQMAQTFKNISRRTLETQFLFPLPDGVAINGLTLIVDGKELPGELKAKDQARREYEAIVRKQKDPALLEYVGQGLFRTSVFPIPAGQERRVEIRYTQLLKSDSGLIDFTLPLGTVKHTGRPIDELNITVRVKSKQELKNVYSPTHDFDITRANDNKAVCRLTLKNVAQPDDTRLLYGLRGGEFGMNLVSYQPDEAGQQGCFMLLASPKVKAEKGQDIPKTVLFVVDRSGSMSGQKIEQAKSSLRMMINQLGDKDTFNIISYASEVDLFQSELELVSDDTRKAALNYVEDIYSGGGTNIGEALTLALGQLQDRARPAYILFFTDGLPTVGETNENAIASGVDKANKVNARIFSFGVGYDVNSRLLDRLSKDQRGTSVYVKPDEDIEVVASNLFRKVSSPAMTDVRISFAGANYDGPGNLVTRVYPSDLMDLFRGEQLIVVGRYRKSTPVKVTLKGKVGGKSREMSLETNLGNAAETRKNQFVQTLWATRRIGAIIDDLDLKGQNQELIDELVALSLKHGIMTPYTSFLADENTSFGDRRRLMTQAESRSEGLSMSSGFGGFSQRSFKSRLKSAPRANSADLEEASDEAAAEILARKFGIRSMIGGSGAQTQAPSNSGRGGFGGGLGGGDASSGQLGATPAFPLAKKVASDVYGSEMIRNKREVAQRVRRIGTKTFYWKNNEWQDSEYGTLKTEVLKKVIEVEQFSDDYFKLTRLSDGRYSRYLSVAEPMLIRIDGKNYRIALLKKK